MTKFDLKTGMRVTYRNGDQRLVLLGTADGNILTNIPKHGDGGVKNKFADLDCEYAVDMINKIDHKWDIMKVETPENKFRYLSLGDDYDVIWQRKEVKKMTVADVARALGYDVEIVKG